jgi:hypothetical protein
VQGETLKRTTLCLGTLRISKRCPLIHALSHELDLITYPCEAYSGRRRRRRRGEKIKNNSSSSYATILNPPIVGLFNAEVNFSPKNRPLFFLSSYQNQISSSSSSSSSSTLRASHQGPYIRAEQGRAVQNKAIKTRSRTRLSRIVKVRRRNGRTNKQRWFCGPGGVILSVDEGKGFLWGG